VSVVEGALLLFGIFGIPLLLLAKSHPFRHLGRRLRGAFWGGVIGYATGILIWGVATIAPAEMWSSGNVRFLAVVIAPALFGSAGLALGALVGNKPKRRPHRQRHKKATPTSLERDSLKSSARSTARF